MLLYGTFDQFVVADRIATTVEFIQNLVGANRRPTGPLADNVVEDSGEVAEDAGNTAGSVTDEATQAGTDISAPGSNDSRTKLTRSSKQSGAGSKDLSGEPSDTDKVAAAGNAIEPAPENDEQLAAPEGDADEGSVLSNTGAQILVSLVLACLLIAIGVALVRRRRTGSRA